MARMDGKVAFITGGASGLGKAEAIMLAREGANVVLFLAPDESRHLNGAEIVIDNGVSAMAAA